MVDELGEDYSLFAYDVKSVLLGSGHAIEKIDADQPLDYLVFMGFGNLHNLNRSLLEGFATSSNRYDIPLLPSNLFLDAVDLLLEFF